MQKCDSCNKHAPVLVGGAPHEIEGEFCPKCCNMTPEDTVELWEDHEETHFGVTRPYANPDSTAPCCEHGRTSFCVCGGKHICPVHGSKCYGRGGHE